MIYEALQIITNQLNDYLANGSTTPVAVVANVADTDFSDAVEDLAEKVIVSLLNLEEEETLKNGPYYTKESGSTIYHNAPIHLNVYLLVSVNITPYKEAIRQLSRVIEFFQGKHLFTQNNTPITPDMDVTLEAGESFRFMMDFYSLSLEGSINLWSNLNSKRLPCVYYKLRILEIQRSSITEERGVIYENQLNHQIGFGQ